MSVTFDPSTAFKIAKEWQELSPDGRDLIGRIAFSVGCGFVIFAITCAVHK